MYVEATVFLIEDITVNLDDKLVKLESSEPCRELFKSACKIALLLINFVNREKQLNCFRMEFWEKMK